MKAIVLTTASGLLVLAGCGREVVQPQMPVNLPSQFAQSGSHAMPERWWTALGDEELDLLIEEALTENFSLRTVWDRLAQAKALAQQVDSTLWPEADLEAGASRVRSNSGGNTSYSSVYSAGVAASYEVDLWSRLSSAQKAAWLDVDASYEAVDTAAITLSVSVASTWYDLGEAKELLRIAQEQTQTNKQVLEIVRTQFAKGVVSAADVFRQQQLVTSTEGLLIVAEEAIQLVQHRLSVLLGRRPELAWADSVIEFPELGPLPDTGLPSQVLWRRPDVRLFYRQVQAADQRLAVAIANQYPRLSISGNVDTTAVHASDLFDDWVANLAANAVQPLFDAGLRKAEVRRQEAIVSEAVNDWGQAILAALQEVEDALVQQEQEAKLLENLRLQLRLAKETYQRNRENYMKGQGDYIRVLESLVSLQSLERQVLGAERALVERRIDLYRSIAGGFELVEPVPAMAVAKNEADVDNVESADNR